jgi:hypothetical protein
MSAAEEPFIRDTTANRRRSEERWRQGASTFAYFPADFFPADLLAADFFPAVFLRLFA